MFFSIAFPDLLVVAHSQWDDHNTRCKLRVFTSREAAEELLSELPTTEAESLGKHLLVLKQSPTETSLIEIDGDAALSLSNFIAAYHNSVAEYKHVPRGPELLGFWEPPENRGLGDGIVMWFDPDDGYQVVITRSKEQAERVIKELRWLEEKWQKLLLKKIRKWHATDQSLRESLRIEASAAELLCRTSVVQKMLNASRSIANN